MNDPYLSPTRGPSEMASPAIARSMTFPVQDSDDEVKGSLFRNQSEKVLRPVTRELEDREKINFGDIFEKLFENVNLLREENKKLKEEKLELLEEKDHKIAELMDQIMHHHTGASNESLDEQSQSVQLLLTDVTMESNKLRDRLEILRQELDLQRQHHEETVSSLQKQFETQTDDKIKTELNLLFESQQKIIERSKEFVEVNEEKLEYYQNLCLSLKTELENIDHLHRKEVAMNKEVASSRNRQDLDNQKAFYEKRIRQIESLHSQDLQSQRAFVTELEELVKSLASKNSTLEQERERIIGEKEELTKELIRIYAQNQQFQDKIDELLPMHYSKLRSLESKYSEEKSNLAFELRTLQRNMTLEDKNILNEIRAHKKTLSHDIKEIDRRKGPGVSTPLMFQLPRSFEKAAEQKSSFYFKNSIVDSVRTNSRLSSHQSKRNLGSPDQAHEEECLSPVKETHPDKEQHLEVSRELANKKSLKASHLKCSIQAANSPPSRVNIINQISNTFILDSASLHLHSENNVELENFSETYYIQEHEKFVKKINEEMLRRKRFESAGTLKPEAEERLFLTMKRFLKNLYTELLLIKKELLKRTLDKFDSYSIKTLLYFDLLAVNIKGFEQEPDGHIEYSIELSDKLLNKAWNFKARYSKLRRLHLETKFSLALEGKNLDISEFPHRRWLGNKDQTFLDLRKRRLQAYFDSYIKHKNASLLIDRGILRHFFYREIWADVEAKNRGKIEELEAGESPWTLGLETLLGRINQVFEEIKADLVLMNQNEALVFIYYQNKFKSLSYKEFKSSLL